jgi:YD repeat-containing protein
MIRPISIGLFAALLLFGAPSASSQELTQYQYDAQGRLVSTIDEAAHTDYSYDNASNRQQVDQRVLFNASWLATALPHNVGFPDAGGWAAQVALGAGHMTYGPYTTSLPAGSHVAVWQIMIDAINGANDNIVTIDVYDATAGEVLAIETFQRNEWLGNLTYQMFEVPFIITPARVGHSIELRTFYHANSYVRVQKIGYGTS